MSAQVVGITEWNAHPRMKKIKWDWLRTDGGVVTGSKTVNKYSGEIIRLVTDPDAAAAAPTDNYDITILDDDGVDVLIGAGANRDTANTEQVIASSLGCVVDSQLTLEIVNAGDAKAGLVILYIKEL